ncbi:MAG: sugar phosphate isomerase/epimerase [Firmicutes bacterium HGW-Firmicutes-21]|nr:MAG: sugar phosphate isomerase/epimerase [Firmicutes bacterium HGW-Firmicutes-21]
MILGAQLYTLRDFTKTLESFSQTLARMAEMGYKTVQVSATVEYEPDWLNHKLKENGLRCVATHFNTDKIKSSPSEAVEFHNRFGCKNIGIGSVPGGLKSDEDYNRFVGGFLPAARSIAASGSSLVFHNHAPEFAKSGDGRLYIERMAEDFLPSELGFILDTYWVQFAGGDPSYWIKRLSGRVNCVHLKDMEYTDKQQITSVGAGNMNFEAIISACEEAGSEYLLVEQDECFGRDPFECLKSSYEYLRSLGLS